ncbi:hypothetical protein FH972_005834 [Carpinus fangiana]|uniref:Uncharacterized protein n=1 Tax=Carpinus fangiana TaxID=176857 RepID=A0A5N6QRG6_9ROSI|nr:hypothetical protein FH972_005834 [Carpinus fangiana]
MPEPVQRSSAKFHGFPWLPRARFLWTKLEEALCNGKRFREPAACKKQQDRSSAYEMRRKLNAEHLASSPPLNERRQDKRWSFANERSWKNSQEDDYGRHDRIDGRGVDDSRMERTLSAEFEWEIMGLENERQKVGGMVISPFTAAASNRGRVEATQNMKMNIANFGLNHMRRGIELGSNKSGNHQKRT